MAHKNTGRKKKISVKRRRLLILKNVVGYLFRLNFVHKLQSILPEGTHFFASAFIESVMRGQTDEKEAKNLLSFLLREYALDSKIIILLFFAFLWFIVTVFILILLKFHIYLCRHTLKWCTLWCARKKKQLCKRDHFDQTSHWFQFCIVLYIYKKKNKVFPNKGK